MANDPASKRFKTTVQVVHDDNHDLSSLRWEIQCYSQKLQSHTKRFKYYEHMNKTLPPWPDDWWGERHKTSEAVEIAVMKATAPIYRAAINHLQGVLRVALQQVNNPTPEQEEAYKRHRQFLKTPMGELLGIKKKDS